MPAGALGACCRKTSPEREACFQALLEGTTCPLGLPPDSPLVLPRICFPVQVNRLPRETLLCATLYALPIPPPGSSSEANKQRRVPEALGWVTTPLFNFRQYVNPQRGSSLASGGRVANRQGCWIS